MAAFAQRPTVVLVLAAGLSLLSVGLCLISPAVSADGVTASHQLAQARRDFRRHATLEVTETRWAPAAVAEAGESGLAYPVAISVAARVLPASVPDLVGSALPRRLLMRPRSVVSRPSGDDAAS